MGMPVPVLMGMLTAVLVSGVACSGRPDMDARFERRTGMVARERAQSRSVELCQRFGRLQGKDAKNHGYQ
jgi:hypothetical protein